jgi:hypothetical protein
LLTQIPASINTSEDLNGNESDSGSEYHISDNEFHSPTCDNTSSLANFPPLSSSPPTSRPVTPDNSANHKRSISQCESPPTSPEKKKGKTTASSAIHLAIQQSTEGKVASDLLKYFAASTKEERNQKNTQDFEEIKNRQLDEEWDKAQRKEGGRVAKAKAACERKKKQREREKREEIMQGKRSPGGTKVPKVANLELLDLSM